jgi:hypothetical protein
MPKKKNRNAPKVAQTLRIFCEGEMTEPHYIKGYLRHFRDDTRTSVVEVMNSSKNTPVQLVEAAIKFKDSKRSIEGDQFWVVYDREAIAKYTRELHSQACDMANANGVNVALSNVCFEFWILLHFVDSSASYSSFDDLKKNSALFAEVQKLCGKKYDKASAMLFEEIKGFVGLARTRAVRINGQGLENAGAQREPYDINPFTDMPRLLDAIDKF